jgi:hypothetical protein
MPPASTALASAVSVQEAGVPVPTTVPGLYVVLTGEIGLWHNFCAVADPVYTTVARRHAPILRLLLREFDDTEFRRSDACMVLPFMRE